LAGLIIVDNSLPTESKLEALDLNCGVCTHEDTEKSDLEKIFNLFDAEKNPEGINKLFNEKICQYHKNKFNGLKVIFNKDNELFLYRAGNDTIKEGKAIPISENEYDKDEEEEGPTWQEPIL